MGATVYYEGTAELATLTNTFTVNGAATDPTTVSLDVTTPSGVTTTYTYAASQITKSGTGVYTKDIACSEDGIWQYVWTGTGAASDIIAGTWTVLTTTLQTGYCTVEEIKARLGITSTADDFELRGAVDAVSRQIDAYCDRWFYRATQTRTYAPADLYTVPVDDLVSVTSLATDASGDGTFETTWATSDFQLLPTNAPSGAEARPYTMIRAVGARYMPVYWAGPLARAERVQVVGVWGWPAVPAAVRQAARVLASEMFKLKDAPFGVAGFGDFGPVRVRQNPIARDLLGPYRRHPVLVG